MDKYEYASVLDDVRDFLGENGIDEVDYLVNSDDEFSLKPTEKDEQYYMIISKELVEDLKASESQNDEFSAVESIGTIAMNFWKTVDDLKSMNREKFNEKYGV